MRSLILYTAITSVALITGANAQNVRGLHKHDASIANHGYSIPIVSSTESGGGDLRQDLDGGKEPANLGIQAPGQFPGQFPSQVPSIGGTGAPAAPIARINPIAVGTQAPDFALQSFAGGTVSLKDLVASGPVLVLFTPGTSTANGLRPLQLLQKNLRQFETLGIKVVAVTPEPLAVIQRSQGQNQFAFHILNDTTNDVSRQYGVLQGYEPVPSLFGIDAAGNVASIQVQQQLNMVFDLKEATDPLRGQTQSAIPAPAAEATQLPTGGVSPEAPIGQVSQDPDLANPVSDAVAPGSHMKPVIPAVPSPQTNKDVPPSNVPKISYDVPPSNPDFAKPAVKQGMTI